MNKEEREIIYTLEGSIDTYIEGTKVIKVQLTTKQAEILLNLISKLQKENEELKEENERYKKAIDNGEYTWKQKYEETFGYVKELKEKLQKENTELKDELQYYKDKENQEFDERDYYEE